MVGSDVRISVDLAGVRLKSPIVLAPGPTSKNGEMMRRAALYGAGAVTTKTISLNAAKVPRPYMAKVPQGLINNDRWSDIGYHGWIEDEIPRAKTGGAAVIASIKSQTNNPGEVVKIAKGTVEAGADMLEVVATYSNKPLPDLIRAVKGYVDVPVIAKIVMESFDLKGIGKEVEAAGADAVSCMDTMGPCMMIDVETGKPIITGRLSGEGIKPFAVYQVGELAQTISIPIIGVGGVTRGRDIIEMMMAGASAVGLCTVTIIKGLEIIQDLNREISDFLDGHVYKDIKEIVGLSLEDIRRIRGGEINYVPKAPTWLKDRCTKCRLCERACIYGAIKVDEGVTVSEKCYGCGVCFTICPTIALISPY